MNGIPIICPGCGGKKIENFTFFNFKFGCICKICQEYGCLACKTTIVQDYLKLENHIKDHYEY